MCSRRGPTSFPHAPGLWAVLALLGACKDDERSKAEPDAGSEAARPCKHYSEIRQPFFGDLHVHTALSLDANLQGTRLRPVDAHRFARGERVGLPPYDGSDQPARTLQLSRPLDFVAISDHAEFLGLVTTCLTPELEGYASPTCQQYRDQPGLAFLLLNSRLSAAQGGAEYGAPCTEGEERCAPAALLAWEEVQLAANGANDLSDQCAFSAFVAYEWSGSPALRNLHRNVIFRDDQVPALPFSYFDGSREEELWDALEKDCLEADTGCDVLTIPHNSNLSAGLMFEPVNGAGEAIDAAYAQRRAALEPLVEIFQHKGSSECLPEMGPDELCSFEVMPYNTLGSATLGGPTDTLTPRDYVRDALGEGLRLTASLGVNPFRYGFVASTDTHLGVSGATDEGSFPGHGGAGSNARDSLPPGLVDKIWFNPGGLAVLWAEENTRESLFDAMRRREAYATSGPRIVLRFFGGRDLPEGLCGAADFVEQGYAHGVPMGGELPAGKGAPRFAVWGLRDPGTEDVPGVPLQRIQIIKGWLEGDTPKYAVFDVAGRADNGASVDPNTCEVRGDGHDELCGVWKDPTFDPAQQAFYYARVLENPSCRWHALACNAAGVQCGPLGADQAGFEGCCDPNFPREQQERAWSSPIFHRAL